MAAQDISEEVVEVTSQSYFYAFTGEFKLFAGDASNQMLMAKHSWNYPEPEPSLCNNLMTQCVQRLDFLKPFLSRAKEIAKLGATAVPAEDLGSILSIHGGGL